jgi:hypothetical protein
MKMPIRIGLKNITTITLMFTEKIKLWWRCAFEKNSFWDFLGTLKCLIFACYANKISNKIRIVFCSVW